MGLAAILLLALVSGALIGCIGIGGVMLVPALSLMGVDVHRAVAAAMVSFIFSGGIATWLFARRGSIDGRAAAWLCLAATPAAFLGALAGNRASPLALSALIGATVIFAGLRALLRQEAGGGRRGLGPPALAAIGGGVGFLSALTGTGGPLLLVPLLVWLDLPILMAVGLSQAIQLPIAFTASLGNLAFGSIEPRLAAIVSAGVIVGTWAGARLAHAVPLALLTRLVGVVLLGVGALLILRAVSP